MGQNTPYPHFLRLLAPALSPEKVLSELSNMTRLTEHEMYQLSERTRLAQVTFKGCSEGMGLTCWWAEQSKTHMQSKSQGKT